VDYLRQQFPQVELIPQERNLGFAAGCNVGMEHALEQGAEFILLVNNDTEVDPDMLAELLCAAEKNPSAAMVSPKIFYFDPPNFIWWAGGRYSLWRGVPSHIGRRNRDVLRFDEPSSIDWATGCVLLLRSEALRHVGLFDERIFGNGEDLDLSLRLRKCGWNIRYAPRARVWHKEGVDYRRNVGEHIRKFTAVRNLLWIMHKHGERWHWLTFLPQFALYLMVTVAQSAKRRDLKSIKATLNGVRAYFEMRRDPNAVALPIELVRASARAPELRTEAPSIT
jgi:GT2 family glycosyltransferase